MSTIAWRILGSTLKNIKKRHVSSRMCTKKIIFFLKTTFKTSISTCPHFFCNTRRKWTINDRISLKIRNSTTISESRFKPTTDLSISLHIPPPTHERGLSFVCLFIIVVICHNVSDNNLDINTQHNAVSIASSDRFWQQQKCHSSFNLYVFSFFVVVYPDAIIWTWH